MRGSSPEVPPGVDVEALGAVPSAHWFTWFLIGLFALMLLGATQQKKGK
jgi:hypothetical protein